MFEIEKDGPAMPENRYTKYPWGGMDVGDSFFIPGGGRRAQINVTAAARNTEFKVATRKENGGIRVWRVA